MFHSQQAAEKALKEFLTWHDIPFRRVHDIEIIGEQCVQLDSSLADLIGRADKLTQYAWRFRYPGAALEPEMEEARAAERPARGVVNAVPDRLRRNRSIVTTSSHVHAEN